MWNEQQADEAGMRALEQREVRRIRETLPRQLPRWRAGRVVREAVALAIRQAGDLLLDDFHQTLRMHADFDGLVPSEARQRLRWLSRRWLQRVTRVEQPWFDATSGDLLRRIGELCWRHRVPMPLVSAGISQFGHGIAAQLLDSSLKRRDMLAAGHYVGSLVHLAQERLATAFTRLEERGARAAETRGLFALGQNMAMERERQQAALLDWAHGLAREVCRPAPRWLVPLESSPLGLWLRHKAPHLFDDAPELALVEDVLLRVDRELVPLLQTSPPGTDALQLALVQLDLALNAIRFHLSDLFERTLVLEGGRDALTQLLNRRFLSTVLNRQVQLRQARRSRGFAVLVLDIDHFKSVNDRYGHDAGDQVLQQAARLVVEHVRAGDFVFRYGGEEVLVVLAGLLTEEALKVAEGIRRRFEATPLSIGADGELNLTVSIGVAVDAGEADPQSLVKRADMALYEAKRAGRNRCWLAQAGA
ncbi:GGDEF domain-containing protein [Leptospira sp. 96542]|nr:GGDEF domain-containing protein [Leptospira sp. 96542]